MKRSIRNCLILLSLVLFVFSCKKENDSPQWDVNILGPLAHATIGVGQLMGNNYLQADPNGRLEISYDTTFSNFQLDSIYQVPDTTIPTVVLFPPFPATIQPDFPFYSNNNNVALGVGGVSIKKAVISSGIIRIDIRNSMHSKIKFTYTIPKAIKNGNPFTIVIWVDSASATQPQSFTGDYDFSGYTVDMTGSTGSLSNTISYSVEARSDPNGVPFTVNASDTVININSSLIGITPSYVKGYLGQTDINEVKDMNVGIGGLIQSGTLLLDSSTLDLRFTNYVGADIQAYVNLLTSHNSNTGANVALTNPSLIQHTINLNRATETSTASGNITPGIYSFHLDNGNSNLKALLENLPDRLQYNVDLGINPLGNISGFNDFVYSDYLVESQMNLKIPLRFAANQLMLVDTTDFNLASTTNLEAIGVSTITMVAKNGFPFDMNLQLLLVNEQNQVIDSLFSPDLIRAASVDANYIVTSSTETRIPIPVNESRKQHLQVVKKICIKASFTTPNYPQTVQLFNSYHLDLKFIADGIYSIR
ncbi:MAG: hypothetical protein IPP51_09945 [Bacteroidetes bacterium]|nr:hypothetical protein [Bacteroidota bacterium]